MSDAATDLPGHEVGRQYLRILLRDGHQEDAEKLCRILCKFDPDPELRFLHARLCAAAADYDQAKRISGDLLVEMPDALPLLELHLGLQVLQGEYPEAVPTADRILANDAGNLVGLGNKAAALVQLHRLEEVLDLAERIIELFPDRPEGYLNKSTVLLLLGLADRALETAETGLRHHPGYTQLIINQVGALLHLQRPQQAMAVLARTPGVDGNLKLLLHRAEAERLLGNEQAHQSQLEGIVLSEQSTEQEAYDAIKRLLEFYDLNDLFVDMGRDTEQHRRLSWVMGIGARVLLAERNFRQLQQALPRLQSSHLNQWENRAFAAIAHAGLGRAAGDSGFFVDMTDADARRLRELYGWSGNGTMEGPVWTPRLDADRIRADYLMRQLRQCDWEGRDSILAEYKDIIDRDLRYDGNSLLLPYETLFMPLPAQTHLEIGARVAGQIETFVRNNGYEPAVYSPPEAGARLKIGYVSGDFRNHATAHLICGLFGQHDREGFEIYAYALHPPDGSRYAQTIIEGVDHFVRLWGHDVRYAVDRIRSDGIHILVDLHGYTWNACPDIFAWRPAPIQVAYLGYAGTSGAAFMDYIVADRVVLPESEQADFSETPIYLPGCYQVTDRWQPIGRVGLTRESVDLPVDGCVFCVFNRTEKFDPDTFAVWMEILRAVPGSVLWLLDVDAPAQANLQRFAEARGVDGSALVFAPMMVKEYHLERMSLADLYLDTPLYNGHTSASDALWAGLPVLTLVGDGFHGRVGASLLHAVAMPEMIMHDATDYRRAAVELGNDPERIAELKARLMRQRGQCALFDTAGFTKSLEAGYRSAWELYSDTKQA